MRRLLIWALLLLCPVLCTAQMILGEIASVRPTVTGGPAEKDAIEYRALKKKDPVHDKMTVVTKKRAGTDILLGPQGRSGTVRMGGNTDLTFSKGLAEGDLDLWLRIGRCLATIWPHSSSDEGIITIETPAGRVTLLGTAVYLDVARDGSTSLFVLEGSVTVESKAGGQVTVPAGSQTFIAAGQGPTTPVPFNVSPGGGPDLRTFGGTVILEPPLIVLDDPRLNLPK